MSTILDATISAVVLTGEDKVLQFTGERRAVQFQATDEASGGETLRLVPALLPAARPLYEIEAHLAALVETEEVVPDELEREYALELQATLLAAVDKRDRVGQFLAHLEQQIAFAHTEVTRLRAREEFFARALARMEGYVSRVIESLGLDAKGKRRKLEGNTITLSLHGCDKRVDVTNEAVVPGKYKRVTVTLPAETWELVCDSLDLEVRAQVLGEVKAPVVDVSLSLVKADLKAGIAVPGAELAGGTYLVRK
jgi:hypothetical protein